MGSTGDSILLVLCLAVTFLALAVGVRLVIAQAYPLAFGSPFKQQPDNESNRDRACTE